jgi:hypothetical protein
VARVCCYVYIIYLTFYSTATFDEFAQKVNEVGLTEEHYNHGDNGDIYFIEEVANRHLSEPIITLSHYFENYDFGTRLRPPPLLTEWDLEDVVGALKTIKNILCGNITP